MRFDRTELDELNARLETMSAEDIFRWAATEFGAKLAIASSMQKPTTVLIHMATLLAPETEVLFVDTGVHFPETLQVRDELIARFGANIRTVAPVKTFEEQYTEYGRHLFERDSDLDPPGYKECCELRKEIPFVEAVRGTYECVMGGLTRGEGGARKQIGMIRLDPRVGAYRLYPLANWTDKQIDDYVAEHGIPVHPLYEKGFASIGCWTCTTPIQPGEDKRAGRWRHIREKNPALAGAGAMYCGINLEDKQPQ